MHSSPKLSTSLLKRMQHKKPPLTIQIGKGVFVSAFKNGSDISEILYVRSIGKEKQPPDFNILFQGTLEEFSEYKHFDFSVVRPTRMKKKDHYFNYSTNTFSDSIGASDMLLIYMNEMRKSFLGYNEFLIYSYNVEKSKTKVAR